MARVRFRDWTRLKTIALLWCSSALLFFLCFRMALHNSTPPNHTSTDPGSHASNWEQRSALYDKMARDLDEKGPVFLRGGETSQSLSLSDIFTLKDGSVTPVLKSANPPVRANVLYLSPEYAEPISQAVRSVFLPHFEKAIWLQNSSMYHFSMFHGSHHLEPVPANERQIEAEVSAIKAITQDLCPLKIVLDRLLLTSTGVLLGCWQYCSDEMGPLEAALNTAPPFSGSCLKNQGLRSPLDGAQPAASPGRLPYHLVISGTDPVTIRSKLREALPRAPKKQLYDPVLLHTSFARLLGQPKNISEAQQKPSGQLHFFHELVARINNHIRGFEAVVSQLWFVEEFDVLALALNGRIKVRQFHLGGCSGN